MFKRALCLPVLFFATLVVGSQPVLAAVSKDPDITSSPATVQSIVAALVAPDLTIGDTDAAAVGIGTDAVGIDSLTNPPADPADSSQGNTFFVSNTPDAMCPAAFPTIQAAVNASGPGDTVKVCPGTYQEHVNVLTSQHDGLKLESLVPLQAIIKYPTDGLPTTLIDIGNGANDVTLRGFTITGPFTVPGCVNHLDEGVLVDNGFREHIHHNLITQIQNVDPAMWGCQDGDAVAVGNRSTGTPGSAEIDHNQIDRYQKNGVQVWNGGTSSHVDHNVVTGSSDAAHRAIIASNGIEVINGAVGVVDHNSVSGNQFSPTPLSSGIILEAAPAGSSRVDHNSISSNDFGVFVDIQSNADISHNDVTRSIGDGITLCGDPLQGCVTASGIVVRANNVDNNGGNGIFLVGATNNLVKSNSTSGNGAAGIHLDAATSGNDVLNNRASTNNPDCEDDSHGAGTAGTNNTWSGDHGATSLPVGICS